MSARGTHLVISVLIGLSAACEVESDTPDGASEGLTSLSLEPALFIGEVDGDPDYLFGDIRSVAVDDEGRVYVGDRIGATVRVYSASGGFLGQIAEEGQGPGEIYGWPADLTFGPDGSLYVRDGSRVSVFAPAGGDGVADSLSAVWTLPSYGNLTYDRSRVGADGTYYYPDGVFRIGEQPRFFYVLLRDGQPTGDTLEAPFYPGLFAKRTAFYRIGTGGGPMVQGLNRVPFEPVPTWDVGAAGTLLSTDGASRELLETSLAGDTLRTLASGASSSRPVPEAEWSDSLAALEARIDSLPVPLDEVINLGANVADRRLPETLPAAITVRVGSDGSIWVERWPAEGAGDVRSYDVYDSDGTHWAAVTLRAPLVAEPPPYMGSGAVVGIVRSPDTGVERVARFDLPTRRSAPSSR